MKHFLAAPGDVRDNHIIITGEDTEHIRRVLRLGRGDQITVSAGQKGRFLCEIEKVGHDSIETRIIQRVDAPERRGPEITLAQALPKGRKMDDIVRMACELGVVEIIPVISERCVSRPDDGAWDKKLMRWRSIANASAKQSRSLYPAAVSPPVKLPELARTRHDTLRVTLWEGAEKSLKSALESFEKPGSVLILIGPEGGFSGDEVKLLEKHGFISASFGPMILRTETAGAVAAGVMIYHFSE